MEIPANVPPMAPNLRTHQSIYPLIAQGLGRIVTYFHKIMIKNGKWDIP